MSEKAEVQAVKSARVELRKKLEARVKRGSAFSQSEDLAIAKAWMVVSEDAVEGFEQKGDVFLLSTLIVLC